jgi:hypothetical protein
MLAYNPSFGSFSFDHHDGFLNNLNVSTLSGIANKCPNDGELVPNELAPWFTFAKDVPTDLLSTPNELAPGNEMSECRWLGWLGRLGGLAFCKLGDLGSD